MELAFIGLSVVFIIAWSYFFLRRDRFEPEPRWLLIRLFFGGVLAAIAAGILNTLADEAGASSGAVIVFVAPPVEEACKLFAVFLFAYGSKHFTQRVDGAIYGISVGLGFAVIEDVFYALEFGPFVLAARSLALPIGHPLFTGVSGYFLAKAKFEGRALWALAGLLIGIALHMAWNAPAGLSELYSDWFALLFLAALPLEIAVLVRFVRRMSHPDAQAIARLVQPAKLATPVSD